MQKTRNFRAVCLNVAQVGENHLCPDERRQAMQKENSNYEINSFYSYKSRYYYPLAVEGVRAVGIGFAGDPVSLGCTWCGRFVCI